MADQSTFSRFPKKQLVFISNKLIEDEFDWNDITDDYESVIEKNESILESVASYFNESVVEEDIQFFIKFIETNQDLLTKINETNDSSLIERLVIPQSNDYLVEYTVDGRCSFTEFYENTEYDNWESENWEVQTVKDIPNNTQESSSPRKLLENTEKLIPKLENAVWQSIILESQTIHYRQKLKKYKKNLQQKYGAIKIIVKLDTL
jgi:hypothetical protein